MRKIKKMMVMVMAAVLVLLAAGCGNNKTDNNAGTNDSTEKVSETGKSTANKQGKYDKIFNNDTYELVYEVLDFSDSYWDEPDDDFGIMTKKEYFFNQYTFDVLRQSGTNVGGYCSMPLQYNYTMYYRISDERDYFLKIDFNKDNVFYQSEITGRLDEPRYFVLDSNMDFNPVDISVHQSSPSIQEKYDEKVICQKNGWTFLSESANGITDIDAQYTLNQEKGDYLFFGISVCKLDDNQINEFIEKIMDNFVITEITDSEIQEYLVNLRPTSYFVEINKDVLEFSNSFKMETDDIRVRIWTESDENILSPYISSTGNVNLFQWYDSDYMDGLSEIMLDEYVNVDDLNAVIEGSFGEDLDVENGIYNNINFKKVYDRNDSYRKENGFSELVGIAFQVDENAYTIEPGFFLTEDEIDDWFQYLFDELFHIG